MWEAILRIGWKDSPPPALVPASRKMPLRSLARIPSAQRDPNQLDATAPSLVCSPPPGRTRWPAVSPVSQVPQQWRNADIETEAKPSPSAWSQDAPGGAQRAAHPASSLANLEGTLAPQARSLADRRCRGGPVGGRCRGCIPHPTPKGRFWGLPHVGTHQHTPAQKRCPALGQSGAQGVSQPLRCSP